MSKMFSIVLSAFACSAFAGSVGQSGTDFVVTAASGESYTNSTDFSGSSKVSKDGEGEAVLNAPCTFSGSDIAVKSGKLILDGATLSREDNMTLKVWGKGKELQHFGNVAISGASKFLWVTGDTGSGGGDVFFGGENSIRDIIQLNVLGKSTFTHGAGWTLLRWLCVATDIDSTAQFRQTGGLIGMPSGQNANFGERRGSRAYFTLEGGEFHVSNNVFFAANAGSFAAFRQTGGLYEHASAGFTYIGRGGNVLFVQTGGTNIIQQTSEQYLRAVLGSTNGVAEATISGAGTEFRTSGILLGDASTAPTTNILTLADGAKLKLNRLTKSAKAAAMSLAVVNVDGGVLAPTYPWNLSYAQEGHNGGVLDHFVVWKKGFIVDTTDNGLNKGGVSAESVLPFSFETPSGKGVEGIALPDLTGMTYIGIGRIVIEDATGWGASAYAEFDFETKSLTHIVVTSRGCNYSDNAKAYLEAPDGKSRMECAMTLSDNAGHGGMIVKRGAPQLDLSAADNTFGGGYAVEEGLLRLYDTPSVAVPVRVAVDAQLDLTGDPLTISTFEGVGRVIGGNVTMTTIKAKCADLFNGRAAAFTGNVTLPANAVLEITDAENLSNYSGVRSVVILSTTGTWSTISGMPNLVLKNSDGTQYPEGDRCSLVLDDDRKTLRLRVKAGLKIVIR